MAGMGFDYAKHNTETQQDSLGACYTVSGERYGGGGGTRTYMYVRATAAVTAMNMVQMESAAATVTDITGFSNSGDRVTNRYPYVEDSGETWTKNAYSGGFLYIAGNTGAGQMKRIRSNTTTRCYFQALYPEAGETDALTTVVDVTSDIVLILPWHVKPSTASDLQQPVIGNAPWAFTTQYFGYIIVPRAPTVVLVKSGGSLTIGEYVSASDDTAGQVAACSNDSELGDESFCGIALHAGGTDVASPVMLL